MKHKELFEGKVTKDNFDSIKYPFGKPIKNFLEQAENATKYYDMNLIKELLEFDTHNIFPINEINKQINKLKTMDTIAKLKKLRDENPALACAIEKEFPEIKDKTPFVFHGSLFMKKQYPNNLYIVLYESSTCNFIVRNIRDNKDWSGTQPQSNPSDNNPAYLTENDFNLLLKQSCYSSDFLKFFGGRQLALIHNELFNY